MNCLFMKIVSATLLSLILAATLAGCSGGDATDTPAASGSPAAVETPAATATP